MGFGLPGTREQKRGFAQRKGNGDGVVREASTEEDGQLRFFATGAVAIGGSFPKATGGFGAARATFVYFAFTATGHDGLLRNQTWQKGSDQNAKQNDDACETLHDSSVITRMAAGHFP